MNLHGLLLTLLVACAAADRVYDFTITWEQRAPAGVPRYMLVVNGETPGPTIEAQQDEWVTVRLHNAAPVNTTMHFHGIEMAGTPWSDGVPGVSQRPVRPGSSFVYRFQATQYGSYWYHSHLLGQIEDGMYGPIVIHPRHGAANPFHLIDAASAHDMARAVREVKPLVMYDYMHITSQEKWDITPRAGVEIPCYDALLFNGKGQVSCIPEDELMAHLGPVQKADLALVPGSKLTDKGCLPANVMAAFGGDVNAFNASAMPDGIFSGCKPTLTPVEVVNASVGRWIALDIVGAVNFISGVVSVDENDMWVYAMDGAYITPQRVQGIPLFNGDRYSVLVRPEKKGNFKIRLNANSAPQTINGYALLSVDTEPAAAVESKPYMDIIANPISPDVVYFNQTVAYPYPPEPIAQSAAALHVLRMRLDGASYLWALNSTRLQPASLDVADPPALFNVGEARGNVTIRTENDTWVDLVLLASVFPMPPHPIHKHGVKMFQIGAGEGDFVWNSVDEAVKEVPHLFNLVNPPRRDTFVSTPATDKVNWVAVRYHVTNPGAWLLHCHIANHMMGGMMMVIMDGVDAWPTVPEEYADYK